MAADNKEKLLREAEKFVRQGKIPQAISEYLKIIRTDAEDVLILNTIGDLYLRQGKTTEANKYFTQVAENYTRNHFLLKAIAVYKKILNVDPQNMEINQTLASLYAKQGLIVEARSQYSKLADLASKQGKARETRDAFEKLAELDPNNASHHLKLADIYLAEEHQEKAASALASAGRAQVKARNLKAALDSMRRSLEINPTDKEVLKQYLDASIEKGEVSAAIAQFKFSLNRAPEDHAIRELYGSACLAAGDLSQASVEFRHLISKDDSRYSVLFALHKAYVEAGELDQAATCFDPIIPILLARLDTERAVEAHNLALKISPVHLLTLTRLAELYSATNDTDRYLKTLDRLAEEHFAQNNFKDALLYLEKFLVLEPSSEKHLILHRQVFSEAYPDSIYVSPIARRTEPAPEYALHAPAGSPASKDSQEVSLVDVDLLLTYGMKEQALQQLRLLETRNPADKEVRVRLLELHKQENHLELASEQCLLLAAVYRNDGDEINAEKMITEARALSPGTVGDDFDLSVFALQHGIDVAESWSAGQKAASKSTEPVEVDLSGDLAEIFFKGDESEAAPESVESDQPAIEISAEEFPLPLPVSSPEANLKDQLQEVDFYLQLGFYDEARTKIREIEKQHPGHPEVESRYQRLPAARGPSETAAAAPGVVEIEGGAELEPRLIESPAGRGAEIPPMGAMAAEPAVSEPVPGPESKIPAEDTPAAGQSDKAKMAELIGSPPVQPELEQENSVTEMFADLLDEVNSLTDQEIAQEDYETHFSLGIAYREMDLLEDAIREFLAAVKVLDAKRAPKEVIQCCGMLSTCFLEKQMPRSALRWCQTGLGVPQISSHEALALRYDMGIAHLQSGEIDKALESFNAIFAVDPSYRDVAQRIDDLKRGPGRHAP